MTVWTLRKTDFKLIKKSIYIDIYYEKKEITDAKMGDVVICKISNSKNNPFYIKIRY